MVTMDDDDLNNGHVEQRQAHEGLKLVITLSAEHVALLVSGDTVQLNAYHDPKIFDFGDGVEDPTTEAGMERDDPPVVVDIEISLRDTGAARTGQPQAAGGSQS
jgi:hypothetical protein